MEFSMTPFAERTIKAVRVNPKHNEVKLFANKSPLVLTAEDTEFSLELNHEFFSNTQLIPVNFLTINDTPYKTRKAFSNWAAKGEYEYLIALFYTVTYPDGRYHCRVKGGRTSDLRTYYNAQNHLIGNILDARLGMFPTLIVPQEA